MATPGDQPPPWGQPRGTAMGMAAGTATVPCVSGAYNLRRGDSSQLLALLGTGVGTFPLGTPPLLGVFWGSQDPPAPHGLPGGQGGGREEAETPRRDEEQLGGGDLSGAAAREWQMVGKGPLVPVPPAHCPFTGCQHGGWHKGLSPRSPRRQPGQGTRPTDTSSTPTPPSPGSARAGGGAGSSPRQGLGGTGTAAPSCCPVGWRGWDEGRGWDGSASCLQALAGGGASPRARPAAAPVGPSPAVGRHQCPKVPRRLPGDPSPTNSETPKERHAGAGGARDPAGSQPGVSAPPDRGLEERSLRGDTCPALRRVPARWRCRRQGEMRGISGLETRSRRCRG